MRAGIGLLSLLIVAGIVLYISYGGKNGGLEGQALTQGRVAQKEAAQIGGHEHPEDSIKLDDEMAGNEFRGLKVIGVTPGGVMEEAYGIKVGDVIVQAKQMDLRGSDSGMAKALVTEGFDMNQDLIVRRDGQEITLKPHNTPLSNARPDLFPKSIPTH